MAFIRERKRWELSNHEYKEFVKKKEKRRREKAVTVAGYSANPCRCSSTTANTYMSFRYHSSTALGQINILAITHCGYLRQTNTIVHRKGN